ncbi:DUF2971 domain-containing protein [Pseudoclavibacter sp. CFCC 13796]|uniref:DUF2971 domain-containing protein n=1 Tax=Pseudoclavibacter sp. CFCC 13796 TaxID=2615179 RepID=UPI0013018745|nr:DUF2971 domain-containing protein [Pseudoclavibacter sp. CFCC 13796]KAB1661366.1 DUF2971 domain-containing protein [Pseudoclavibacter sp. CFCC 13796]
MIYHYTSIEGLLGILSSCALWASDPLYLNDAQELIHGANLIRSLIDPDGAPSDRSKGALASTPIEALKRLRSEIDTRYPTSGEVQTFHEDEIYLVSFTEVQDSLDMWRGYAPGRGFCIGFDEGTLLQACNVQSDEEAFETFHLAPRESLSLWQSHIGLDHSIVRVSYAESEFMDEIQRVCSQIKPAYIPRLSTSLAAIKDPAFKSEQEVRLIVNPTGDLSPRISLRTSPTNLVPYIPLEFPHAAIKSIMVGPGPYAERSRRSLEAYFSDGMRGEWSHVDLRLSSVPYIG